MFHNPRSLTSNLYLDDLEYERFRMTLFRNRSTEIRNVLALELLIETGPRASELLNLTTDSINIGTRSILIQGLKGSDSRDVPLKGALFNRLLSYSKSLNRGAKLFPFKYHRLRYLWVEYRPCDKKLHALRHTFARRAYIKTLDIRLVQHLLGHRSVLNTEIYTRVKFSPDEIRGVLLKAG